MKKQIAMLSAAALSVGMLLPQAITVSAVNGTMDTLPYNIYFEPQRTSISADEVASGDVTITTPLYIYGSTANGIGAVSVKYDSSSNNIYFKNIITGSTFLDSEQTFETSMGTLTSKNMPYCFGKLHPDGSYMNGSPMITTKEYACDPIYGSTLYSTGDGRVKFKASFYETSDRTQKVSKEFVCDVTVDAEGNGTYSFDYIDQTSFMTRSISTTIPRYDATLPEGKKIPDACNSVLCLPGSGDLSGGMDFFGKTSNEFPLFQIDVIVKQGTPCGIYTIDFSKDVDVITGADCQMTSAKQKDYQINMIGTSIAVGVESAVVTSVTKDDAAFYAAHDTHVITGADFATQILADVTYEDGTVEQNVDITNLVTCNSATPADLYKAAENNCFISDVPLCIGDKPVKTSDGSNLTQHILVGMKGDVNFNGTVDMFDAYQVLLYNSYVSAGGTPVFCENPIDPYQENLAYFMADIDTCSKKGKDGGDISMMDAYNVLLYNSYLSAGSELAWDSMMK